MGETVEERLISVMEARLGDYLRDVSLSRSTRLFAGGIELDSFGAFYLLTLIEEHFGIQLEGDSLTEANFQTPDTVAALLRRLGVS